MSEDAARAGADAPGAMRRRVAVLFTDLTGSTRLGRAMEPEEYAAVVEAMRGIWLAEAARHGGRVVRSQGDGALVLFGAELAGEDDGRRAVACALAIHARVRALDLPGVPAAHRPLQMHSGVHAGVLLVAPGDRQRGELDLTGDVVNTAAHLASAAGPGQVLASLAALGPHEHLFEVEVPAAGAGGLPAGMVRVVHGATGLQHRFDATSRRGLTPLVGRRDALARLQAFTAGQGAARDRVLVLQGEAGIGKTRLLAELEPLMPAGMRMLRGTCEQPLDAQALQPFLQMVQAWGADAGEPGLQRLRQEAPAAAAVVLPLLGQPGPDAPVPTAAGVLAWLTWLAGGQDVLLVVDDWQWADDASLQLMAALLARSGGPLVLLAMRPLPGVLPPAGAQQVLLRPLSGAETEAAVRRWMPAADPFLCGQIHRYSGGIPLYVEELCHSATAGELGRAIETAAGSQNWVASLAAARLARLPEPLARIVRAAAVVGNEAPLRLLAAMLGESPAPAQLQALARADFLYLLPGRDGVQFKHGITRDAIYAAVGLEERRRLHVAVLQALHAGSGGTPRPGDAEALAHHSRGAGRWAEAATHAEQAGDRAFAAFAVDRARRHYEQALQALDRAGVETPAQRRQWCGAAARYGMSCVFDPLPLQGDAGVFEGAVALAHTLDDANLVARAEYWLAYIQYALGRFRESQQHIARAREAALASDDQRLVVQVDATRGQILAGMGEAGPALALIDQAVGAKRQRRPGGGNLAIGSAYALACKGSLLADAGQFADAHACFDEALALLDGSTHPVGNSVRNWIAVAWNWQGCWDQARQVARESEAIAQGTRALLLLSSARGTHGYAAWRGAGDPAGLAQMEEAMRWMADRRSAFCTSLYHGWLAAAHAGDPARARPHVVHVLRRSRQGERFGEAAACRCMAWQAAVAGDRSGAARWLARARVAAQHRGSAREAALAALAQAQVDWRLGAPLDLPRLEPALERLDALAMHWHREQALAMLQAGGVGLPLLT